MIGIPRDDLTARSADRGLGPEGTADLAFWQGNCFRSSTIDMTFPDFWASFRPLRLSMMVPALPPDPMFSIRLVIAGLLLANATCSFASGMTWGLHTPAGVVAAPAAVSAEPRPQLQMASQLQMRKSVEALALQGAEQLIGVRYHFGASSTSATDCSGLVKQAYAQAGVPLPRSAAAMMSAVEPIGLSEIRPGDLVFFKTGRRRLHVGLYQGEGMFVHASPKQREVIVSALDQRWRKQLIGAGRVIVALN